MCSPVSSKAQSSGSGGGTGSGVNPIGSGVSPSGIHSNNPMQQGQFQSSVNYNEHQSQHQTNKAPGSLAVARPVMSQQSMEMSQYNRQVYPSEMGGRGGSGGGSSSHQHQQQQQQQQQHVMQQQQGSSSQASSIDVNLFKSSNSGFEHQNVNSSLLRMVPSDAQAAAAAHPMMPFHPHMQSFAQTMGGQSSSVNTTVSMSRLNPRAPDFSSSLHLNNKAQVTMLNPPTGLHPNMFANVPGGVPSSANAIQQSNNLAMLGAANFPMGKYQQGGGALPPPPPPPGASRVAANLASSNGGQTRWPFVPPPNNCPPPPHQDPMMGQISFPNHLGSIAGQSANIDLITSLENGGSPAMSPSSPAQVVAQEISQIKIEDRKVPRPIGTERAWKNYTTGMGPGGDADSINWMLNNEKLVNSWANIAQPGMDRHQMFRPNTSYNRMSNIDAELHQMMESTFQVNIHYFSSLSTSSTFSSTQFFRFLFM